MDDEGRRRVASVLMGRGGLKVEFGLYSSKLYSYAIALNMTFCLCPSRRDEVYWRGNSTGLIFGARAAVTPFLSGSVLGGTQWS